MPPTHPLINRLYDLTEQLARLTGELLTESSAAAKTAAELTAERTARERADETLASLRQTLAAQKEEIHHLRTMEPAEKACLHCQAQYAAMKARAETLEAEVERLRKSSIGRLHNLADAMSECNDCGQPASSEDGQHDEGPHILCHDCAVQHQALREQLAEADNALAACQSEATGKIAELEAEVARLRDGATKADEQRRAIWCCYCFETFHYVGAFDSENAREARELALKHEETCPRNTMRLARDAALARAEAAEQRVGVANIEHAELTERAVVAEQKADEFSRVALGNAEEVLRLEAALAAERQREEGR